MRSILKNYKIPSALKNQLLKPTKIYSEEILKFSEKKNLIHSAAHITGGGLVENLFKINSVKFNFKHRFKIKILKIFKWIKSKNIADSK